MAENQVNINLSLLDQQGTIKKRTAEVENLNNQLDKTQKLASNAFSATGTKAGAQALRATEAPDSTVRLERTVVSTGLQDNMREQSRPQPRRATYGGGGDNEDYTVAGGVMGRGGAAARDFADQARGLNGLVRLYAEYAARLFAVSAAFTALRDAAQTDIMVRGMEQLGASTGTSLTSMTKGFITATDGMVSFREAAEAVTKATTSGMGQDQVMAIAQVAKGASQALGLNMGDAVSRLTRGITKLEPELLDELGIFTKLDKAVTDYARSVGKSESALTDFERRQAFANAVLKEGKDKFAEIAQEGNPYDKLLANLKDVAQKILSVINTVVGPIAKIFADNSLLIVGAIGLIASKIVTKAIPALNSYGEYLRNAAAEAAKVATQESHDASFGRYQALRKSMKIDEQLKPGEENLANLTKQRALLQDQIDKLKSIGKYTDVVVGLQNKQQLLMIEINKQKQIQSNIETTLQNKMDVNASLIKEPWEYMKSKIAEIAKLRSASLDIKAQVVDVAATSGPIAAFSKLNELLKTNTANMGLMGKAATYLSSTVSILGQTILTVGGYLAGFIKYIGLAIAVFEIYDKYFSGNSKETELFNSKLSTLNDTVKTAMDVNVKYQQSLSLESVLAYSSSFNELTESLKKATDQYKEVTAAASGLDKFFNDLRKGAVIGKILPSREAELATATGSAVGSLIKSLGNRPLGTAYKETIGEILGLKDTEVNAKNVASALEDLRRDEEKFANAQDAIVAATDAANKKFQEQTLYLRGLKDAAQTAEKSAQTFMNSLKDTSNLSTMMENNIKYLVQLDKALQSSDQFTRIAAVDSLKDANFGAIFGSAATDVARLSDEFEELQPHADAANKELGKVTARIDELRQSWFLTGSKFSELSGLVQLKQQLEDVVKLAQDKAAQIALVVSDAVSRSVKEQIAQTVQKFNLEMQKLAVDQAKFMASKAPVKTEGLIDYQAKLDKQAISIESQLVTAQYDLADSIDRLNSTVKLEQDLRKKEVLERLGSAATPVQQAELAGINRRMGGMPDASGLMLTSGSIQAADNFLAKLNAGQLKGMSQTDLVAEAQKLLGEFPEKMAQFNRALQNQFKKASAAYKMQQVDITATIDKIDLRTQQSIEKIDSDIQAINTAISNIGGDTPERLQIIMDAADIVLTKELDKIEMQTQAKLDKLATLSLPSEKVAEQKDRINVEDTLAKKKVEQAAAEKRVENAAQKTYLTEKRRLDIVIKTAEAQKGLIVGGGIAAERARQSLDSTIIEAQNTLDLLDLQKQLTLSQGRLDQFREKLKGSEGLSSDQIIQYQVLSEDVQANEKAIKQQKELGRLRLVGSKAQSDMNILTIKQGMDMADLEVRLQGEAVLRNRVFATREETLNIASKELDVAAKYGLITDKELQVAQSNLAIAKINLDLDRESATLLQQKLILEQQIKDEQARNPTAVRTTKILANGEIEVDDGRTEAERRLQGQLAGIDSALEDARTKASRGIAAINKELEITPRMDKFNTAFVNMFEGMGNAIVDFAATGKWAMKDVINSFLLDIARYEMRLQMHALYMQAIRPLLGSLLPGLFGFSSYAPGTFSASNTVMPQFGYTLAKGGVFDSGIKTYGMGGAMDSKKEYSLPGYAKGGMFTNKIVAQPTLFKAAKGLGVMGEAGPEAIMPLARDSNGTLGVRANSANNSTGNVEVVVNNYTAERAETKETVDSRGNRRIEVVVGEMVATQMTTPNSSVQQAMLSGFGARPRMVRR